MPIASWPAQMLNPQLSVKDSLAPYLVFKSFKIFKGLRTWRKRALQLRTLHSGKNRGARTASHANGPL